jgi:hypothetical protein
MDKILRLQSVAYQSEAAIYNNCNLQPLTQTIEYALREFNDCVVVKAVCQGNIIGSVRVRRNGDTVSIGKLMVLPARQNKGL